MNDRDIDNIQVDKLIDGYMANTMLSKNITFLFKTYSMIVVILLKTCKMRLYVIYEYAYTHVKDFIPK